MGEYYIMLTPISLSEQMMYNTVRIETNSGCGTGSFFNFQFGEQLVPTIITNKHVVNYNPNEEVRFALHLSDEEGNPAANILLNYNTDWLFHPDKDLCCCFVNPIFNYVYSKFGRRVFFIANTEELLLDDSKKDSLSALEELVMVGYPIGLHDMRNNFPIFRKGYTAAHPVVDFNEDGIGLVDMTCLPGSSGSPIYILNEGSFRDKYGNISVGQSRIMLLGYLYSGPFYNATGEVVVQNIPTAMPKVVTSTQVMANLGYYIKSDELLKFKPIIKDKLKL